jgi:hypothetical protein
MNILRINHNVFSSIIQMMLNHFMQIPRLYLKTTLPTLYSRTVHDVGMCSVGVHTAVVHWSELACSEHAWHDHA